MPAFYQRVLDAAGIPPVGPGYAVPNTPADRSAGRESLHRAGWDGSTPLVGLNGGARFGSSKLWSPERFGQVGRALWERTGRRPVVFGGPGEGALGERIAAAAGPEAIPAYRDVVDLRTLIGQLSHLDLLITNDTGPRHLAVALDIPVVAIFGSTDRRWTDWNLERTRVVAADVPCGPCHLPRCPFDLRCLEHVSVERVLAAAESLLVR